MTPEEHSILDSMKAQLKAIFDILQGQEGNLGLSQKVAVMWRAHVWVFCTLSAAAGAIFLAVIQWAMRHLS